MTVDIASAIAALLLAFAWVLDTIYITLHKKHKYISNWSKLELLRPCTVHLIKHCMGSL